MMIYSMLTVIVSSLMSLAIVFGVYSIITFRSK